MIVYIVYGFHHKHFRGHDGTVVTRISPWQFKPRTLGGKDSSFMPMVGSLQCKTLSTV